MTRDEAISLARKHIDACHPGEHPDFMPVPWVIAAILDASHWTREELPGQAQLPF